MPWLCLQALTLWLILQPLILHLPLRALIQLWYVREVKGAEIEEKKKKDIVTLEYLFDEEGACVLSHLNLFNNKYRQNEITSSMSTSHGTSRLWFKCWSSVLCSLFLHCYFLSITSFFFSWFVSFWQDNLIWTREASDALPRLHPTPPPHKPAVSPPLKERRERHW